MYSDAKFEYLNVSHVLETEERLKDATAGAPAAKAIQCSCYDEWQPRAMLSARVHALRRAGKSTALVHLRLSYATTSFRSKSVGYDGTKLAAKARGGHQLVQSSLFKPYPTTTAEVASSGDGSRCPRNASVRFSGPFEPTRAAEAVGSSHGKFSADDSSGKILREKNEDAITSRNTPEDPLSCIRGGTSQSPGKRKPFDDEDHEFPFLPLPTDPDKLKALPTGFSDMTEREQQEELWIVHAEDRLGREWKLEDPGKHTWYDHYYPPYSPSKVIGMLHRWRNYAWTAQQWRLARAIARNRTLRFPVLTAQAFLRRHALLARRRGVELKIERYLGGTKTWKARLAELESQTGVSEADIKQWLWILSPESGDLKIQRFLKSKCRKPLFLLQLLLAKDKKIHEPATFLGLLKFMRENYVLADRPKEELDHPAYKRQGRAMTWWHYLVLLYRLVWQCRERWPAAMPLLARLTADYIGTMRLDTKARALTGHQARSLVLNRALRYLAWPARVRPFDHMEHNWAAQRHLLRLAATAEPPLVMDQKAYRAVRTVLIALQKTRGEARNAARSAQTWPPYRRTLDGIDERRDPEDDLSRSAKAGILAREAGYSDDIVDRALSALGGSTFGQAPAIQTRSLPPVFYSGRLASHNIFAEWAAQLRATRNAREAWIVFENPPEPGLRPTAQIYGEMFEKLYARPASELPAIRPGDVREVFPVYDGNLSEFEIARLTPPSPEELYDHMLLQDKLKPTGLCLAVLIRNAGSRATALRYLDDSPYKPYIQALRVPAAQADVESLKTLSGVPLNIFNAWITMLCHLHTREPQEKSSTSGSQPNSEGGGQGANNADGKHNDGKQGHTGEVSQGSSIPEAITLATAFQAHNAKAASRDRQPWHTIMKALAGRKVLYSQRGAEFNILETLTTFIRIYERTTMSKGIDPAAFEALCLMIRKALKLMTFEIAEGGKMVPRQHMADTTVVEKLLWRAHRYAVKTFESLISPIPDERLEETDVSSERMVRLMDWLLDGWDREYIREEAKTSYNIEYHYTIRTIAYFAEMGRELVEPAELDRVRQRLENMRQEKGCTWFWPQDGWQGAPEEQALLELETDLVVIERWPRLRQMINSTDTLEEDPEEGPGRVKEASANL
ncbi:hypothetical protein VTH82DRAFT_6463 [Thermothelomyces myriococcoides]